MAEKRKRKKLDARLAAIEAVEAAARDLEEASNRYEEASRAFMEAARDKSKADDALRAALAALRQVNDGGKS